LTVLGATYQFTYLGQISNAGATFDVPGGYLRQTWGLPGGYLVIYLFRPEFKCGGYL
jgi:hypothetical protein